jgi:hypothetical protein
MSIYVNVHTDININRHVQYYLYIYLNLYLIFLSVFLTVSKLCRLILMLNHSRGKHLELHLYSVLTKAVVPKYRKVILFLFRNAVKLTRFISQAIHISHQN